jgi:hypothetical protein
LAGGHPGKLEHEPTGESRFARIAPAARPI